MTTETETIRHLAEMNDVAAFERIATAVLRAADPRLYANLSHPGVQPGGKTVKAPFDNVGWVQLAEVARFVCAAHTTEKNDLRGKWLHDPAKVKIRKPGGKPTKPAGDLIKGIEEIQKLRSTDPNLLVTFALTTTRETPFELRTEVEKLACTARVELDIWSVSRISHFLDTDPIGQIIRRNYLGTPVKLISRELLLKMGKRSIQDYLPRSMTGESICRDDFILGRSDTLVVGASGMGKTTACSTVLVEHIETGQPALVIKTEFLITAATMEAALEGELRRQEPELEADVGRKALSLFTKEEPLLLLMEDINRSNSPGLLLNKILAWTLAPTRQWRAICPIWPRYLDVIEDQKRVLDAVTVLCVDRYSPAEAIRAIRKRAEVLGLQIDEHRAMSIAERLGNDPLLIGLHDLTSEEAASGVIDSYIEERLGIVASEVKLTKSEVAQALHLMLRCMLQHRNLGPKWGEAKSWIDDKDAIHLIRDVAREGSVIRISYAAEDETLEFRHDRIMHNLLSRALAEVLKSTIPEYATDPFFAEVVAGAAVQVELPFQQLLELMDSSPTVAAHALRLASEIGSRYTDIAVQALGHWLQREGVREDVLSNRRYAVANVLAEITNPYVRHLVSQFPSGDSWWHPLLSASFRNGNLSAGLTLLSMHEIGVTVSGKKNLLALVKRIYGHNLVVAVDEILRRPDLNQPGKAGIRIGVLRLAGYLGDSSLAQAVRVCWDQSENRDNELRSHLFAAARCCGDAPGVVLGPVCDAWEAMPEEPESVLGHPAERLASEYVAWEFRDYPPVDALRYFVERAKASEKIGWPITYMLRTVDHPDAVEQIARYAAKYGFTTASSLRSDWERGARVNGKRMSSRSKKRLLKIAQDEAESDNVRKWAFNFWEVTLDETDLDIARQIPVGNLLYERALWARARRRDNSVIPEVLKKIPENPVYWLEIARYIWSDELTEVLNPLLDQIAEGQEEDSTDLEYAVTEALQHVEQNRMISMLAPRWAKLKIKPLMVQTVLLSTVPAAVSLAHEALTGSQNPVVLLKYFATRATMNSKGKLGLTVPAQLQNLKPYLDFFSLEEIELLWEICTKREWFDFRDQYLEPRMKMVSSRQALPLDDPVNIKYLDRALVAESNEIINLHHWLDTSVRRGTTREKVFAEMLDWLKQHDEMRALAIVADIVSREATRREFHLFEVTAGNRTDSASSVEEVRFNVFSRSLV
jgi:hypothetical protein